MEKKNYEFIAFNGRNERIEMELATVFYDITEEMAQGIRMGIEIGLAQKYKGAYVRYRDINAAMNILLEGQRMLTA